MIADLLVNAEHYVHVHPGLKEAFAFLRQEKTKQLEPGRYAIDGTRLFALVESGMGKGTTGRRLEYHRKYIDIQYVRAGVDVMGWKPLSTNGAGEVPGSAFDEGQDAGFINDTQGVSWTEYPEGSFAVFFPHDAHTPMAGQGPIEKVIVKLAVNPE